MLTKIDKSKILKLRSEDFSYQAIHEKLGFAIDTIMQICKQEEKQKNQEKEHSLREKSSSNDPISMLKRIANDICNVIETGKLNDRDRWKWEKQTEDIQAILKSEVDDRISKVRPDAIEKSDAHWNREIKNKYVRKEIVADLENTIKEKNNIIVKLRSEIEKNDRNLIEKKGEISRLEIQLDEIYDENIFLNNENWRKQKYIDDRFDLDVKIQQDRLNNEINAFNSEKEGFFRYKDKQQSNLDKSYLEAQAKCKTVEKLKKKLEKQSEEIKQRKDEFYQTRENYYEDVRKNISERKEDYEQIAKQWNMIKKTEEQQKIEGKRLRKLQIIVEKNGFLNHFSLQCPRCTGPIFFDASEPEIKQKIKSLFGNYMHPECRPKSEQQKHVILRPVSLSGEPVIQSGFSPIIQSGGEPIVVECSGEPVVRSGISPIIKSGEELEVFGSNGESLSQSGVST